MSEINSRSLPSHEGLRSSALTTQSLRALLGRARPPAVTLTAPIDPTQLDSEHARLTLKNLLADARRQLAEWPELDADALLAEAVQLADGDQWWRGPGRAVVLCSSPGVALEQFRVAEPLAPRASVDSQFAVRWLLQSVHTDDRFLLLAITQNDAQLYTGDRFGIEPWPAPLSPRSLADARRYFEHSNALNTHGGGRVGEGRVVEGVHGQGSARDSRKSELREYFRRVDDAVRHAVSDTSLPLLLAIDATQFPLYREASRHPQLMSQFVAGNTEYLTADELHQRAWAVYASQAEDARDTAIARYRDAIGTAQCTTFASDIVAASAAGRVDTIFINGDRPIWGRVDDQGLVLIDDDRRPRGEDLVNRSVAHTLLHGGEAYGQVDLGVHAMAALLRY